MNLAMKPSAPPEAKLPSPMRDTATSSGVKEDA